MGFDKIRKSHNGNDIYSIPVGTVEGTPTKFSTGRKGYRIFGKFADKDGNVYQVTGNLIQL